LQDISRLNDSTATNTIFKSYWSRYNNKQNKLSTDNLSTSKTSNQRFKPSLINCLKLIAGRTPRKLITGDNATLLYSN